MPDTNFSKTISVKLDSSGNVTFPGPHNQGGTVHMYNPKNNPGVSDNIKFELTSDSVSGAKVVGVAFPNVTVGTTFGSANTYGYYGTANSDGSLDLPDNDDVTSGETSYEYCLHVQDSSGTDHSSDPQILNDPPPK